MRTCILSREIRRLCLPRRLSQSPSYSETVPSPQRITCNKERNRLTVYFGDETFSYAAEYLRVFSPSVGALEMTGPYSLKRVPSGRMYVGISGIHKVGRYAVRIDFDDMVRAPSLSGAPLQMCIGRKIIKVPQHSTGIYSWNYLYALGIDKLMLMRKYIRLLRSQGQSRNPKNLTKIVPK